jgi:hypothetical protein
MGAVRSAEATVSLIPSELSLAPMVILAVRIENALNVAVQGSQDANTREHRRAAEIGDQYQRLDCRLPLR